MGLFGFGKKMEKEQAAPACCCGETPAEAENCCCSAETPAAAGSCCCGEHVEGVCCVKVLGAGCKSCHEQYENAQQAVKAMGLDVEVEYVTDMEKVMAYGVMRMPALVVNEKVVACGKVLKAGEVEALLHQLGF